MVPPLIITLRTATFIFTCPQAALNFSLDLSSFYCLVLAFWLKASFSFIICSIQFSLLIAIMTVTIIPILLMIFQSWCPLHPGQGPRHNVDALISAIRHHTPTVMTSLLRMNDAMLTLP